MYLIIIIIIIILAIHANVTKMMFCCLKMADTSKDELLLGGRICHVTVCHSVTRTVNKFLFA